MPAPCRRVTQGESRAPQQALRERCAENGVDGPSLSDRPDHTAPPAAIRLAARIWPGRATPEPVGLPLDGVAVHVQDGLNDQTPARVLALLRAW